MEYSLDLNLPFYRLKLIYRMHNIYRTGKVYTCLGNFMVGSKTHRQTDRRTYLTVNVRLYGTTYQNKHL